MSIVATLVDVTPHRLAYLCTADGVVSSPPVLADRRVIIPNAGGVTPDLRTDLGTIGISLRPIVRANVDGLGNIAAGTLTAAEARALFLLDDPTAATLTNQLIARAIVTIRPRTGAARWFVDVAQDTFEDSPPGTTGDPVLVVGTATTLAATAIVEILALHSVNQ